MIESVSGDEARRPQKSSINSRDRAPKRITLRERGEAEGARLSDYMQVADSVSGRVKRRWMGDIDHARSSRKSIRDNTGLYDGMARGIKMEEEKGKQEEDGFRIETSPVYYERERMALYGEKLRMHGWWKTKDKCVLTFGAHSGHDIIYTVMSRND